MERKMTFDELWEQEELHGLNSRLRGEYPKWKLRRKYGMTIPAVAVVLVLATFSIFNFHFSIPKGYDAVCCNRNSFPESHWADVAHKILTIESL